MSLTAGLVVFVVYALVAITLTLMTIPVDLEPEGHPDSLLILGRDGWEPSWYWWTRNVLYWVLLAPTAILILFIMGVLRVVHWIRP